MEADFSGYATRNGLKCSDGLTIMAGAFKHNDQSRVPLVWQHQHNEVSNVLGHAVLENREDGVYAYGFFNDSESAKNAKEGVKHGDIVAMSIYANNLTKRGKDVMHGDIREVSLVLSGANPGALIDFVSLKHGDSYETLEDEAIIYTDSALTLEHAEKKEEAPVADDKTVKDVFDSLNEEQKNVVYFMIGEALEQAGSASHSDDNSDDLYHQENFTMPRNVFDQSGSAQQGETLTHDQMNSIFDDAKKSGSLKESFLSHADDYGITNIDMLFPDAQTLQNTPELIGRRTEWVSKVINGTRKSPFSRIKSMSADITHDEARAKGYIKGNLKKEEFFSLQKRETTPFTIYKKQKLDRDDIIDVTSFNVVAWLKAEMRLMLDEEIARAILIGDGREIDDEDKIDETKIRPIARDDDFYTHKVVIPTGVDGDALVEAVLRARPVYRGKGNPTFFCTENLLTDLLLLKDKMGRRLYSSKTDLANALRVSSIETVEVLESTSVNGGEVLGILVNLADYTVGADAGGKVSMFDDFDIDYNQYKYLIEGRMSGCLTKFKSAQVFTRGSGTLVTPEVPTFDESTNVVTIPSVTGVTYTNFDTGATLTAGAQPALATGESIEVEAVPNAGYYFATNTDNDWVFTGA